MKNSEGTLCNKQYYFWVADYSITLLAKMHQIVFIRIEHEADELLPIVRNPMQADRLIKIIETIDDCVIGPWTTPSEANTFFWKKVFLIYKLEAMKALWQLQEVEEKMASSPLTSLAIAIHEAAIDMIYDRYTTKADTLRIFQADFYKVKAEKDYLKLLCAKARVEAFWNSWV